MRGGRASGRDSGLARERGRGRPRRERGRGRWRGFGSGRKLRDVIWRFGDCELDEERYQVLRRGRVVKLEPRVFDVLLHLLRHRERVVSKRELLDAFWPGLALSDSVLPRCIGAARRAVGRRAIRTAHGRGYQLAVPAEAMPPELQAEYLAEPGSAFVGREDAMGELRAALAAAAAGRGGVALLVGEPGIGKTRTLDELGALARRQGVRWLAGRCVEGDGAPAFWPFVQIQRALAALRPAARAPAPGARGRGSPRAPLPLDPWEVPAHGAEGSGPLGAAAGEQARFRLFDGVAEALRRAAAEAPLLVSVDDLHQADGDSLRLFRFLAGALRHEPVLLVGTYRDVEVRRGHRLAETLAELAREPRVLRVALRGLGAEEIARLVASVVAEPPGAALVRALAELTEGNPFFVREMARWLAASGRLGEESPRTLTLPQGVRDTLGRRLDALSPACNDVLRVAAVIGREFAAPLLGDASGIGAGDLQLQLAEAFAAGVVVEDGEAPGRYAFAHALLRQTLYEEIPAPQRVALHRRVADALVESGRHGPRAPASELAHHFYEALPAGTTDACVEACVAAAAAAHERVAYDEAARLYERALHALEFARPPDDARRAELLVALGEEEWTDGRREAGRARIAEAAELARRLGSRDLLARAAIAYRGFGEMGMPPDATTLRLLEEARDALGPGHPALRARLLARLAGTPPYSLSMPTRRALADEARGLAADSQERPVLVDAIVARYWAALGPDGAGERLAIASEAAALAARTGDRRLALLGHEIALAAHLLRGDVAAADVEIARFELGAEESREPVFRFLAGMIRAGRALSAGDFAGAEEWMQTAQERGRASVPYADGVCTGQRLLLLLLRGELEQAAQLIASGADRLAGFAGTEPLLRSMQIRFLLVQGRVEPARVAWEALGARDFLDLERDEHWLFTIEALTEAAAELGDARRGAILYAALEPYAALLVSHDLVRVATATVEGLLGRLALACDRPDAALAHAEAGEARARAAGLLPALGQAQSVRAAALLRRGARGDRARARRLLAELDARGPSLARRRARPLLEAAEKA